MASRDDAGRDAGAKHCISKGFAPAVSYPVALDPEWMIAIDRTGNGHLDLLVGDRAFLADGGEPVASALLVNAGDGTFASNGAYGATGNVVRNMVAADFNGDGKLDLASQWSDGPVDGTNVTAGKLGIDFGTDDGRFASRLVTYSTPEANGALTMGDFNGDGHPDIAFAGYNEIEEPRFVTDSGAVALPGTVPADFALNVFLNRGDGTFGAPRTYPNQRRDLRAARDVQRGRHEFARHSCRRERRLQW
jgi:hypothetical protein